MYFIYARLGEEAGNMQITKLGHTLGTLTLFTKSSKTPTLSSKAIGNLLAAQKWSRYEGDRVRRFLADHCGYAVNHIVQVIVGYTTHFGEISPCQYTGPIFEGIIHKLRGSSLRSQFV